jgi:hypothetical protein
MLKIFNLNCAASPLKPGALRYELAVEYKTFQLSAIITLLHGLTEPARMEMAAEGVSSPQTWPSVSGSVSAVTQK